MADYENLVELLERSLDLYEDNRLFGVKREGEYEWMTYGEFGQQVDAYRAALADLGIEKGDVVGIIADNRVEWAAAAYATYGRGALFCPMYEDQAVEDWRYIIDDSGAKLVLTAGREIYDQVGPLTEDYDHLEEVFFFDGPADHDDAWDRHVESTEEAVESIDLDRDDLMGFIYTSGTTGDPKGVKLSHWNICSNLHAVHEVMPIHEEDVSLSFLPWAHSFGQVAELHALVSTGASLGLAESVDKILENLEEVRPTLLFSVPRIFNKIYDGVQTKLRQSNPLRKKLFEWAMANSTNLREQKETGKAGAFTSFLDSIFDSLVFQKIRDKFGCRLRYAFSGGAALSPEVAKFIDNLHITVYEGYGLTETSPVVSVNSPDARKIGSVGQPVPGVDVEIRPVEGYEDGTGEICVRGPNVMQGYHNLPEETEQVLDEDGTFHTGDLGRLDEDDFLWILGRVKAQYKLENGKYVVPAPVEEQYKLSPYIEQIMIEGTGCPHNVAVIVANVEALEEYAEENGIDYDDEDDLLDHRAIQQLFREEMETRGEKIKPFERPKDFVLTTDEWTPENGMLTPTLKLKRREIMAEYGQQLADLYDDAVPLAMNVSDEAA
ncbi:MAG: long-chain fatty acid--CoA ligase [Bradymonadaceae bacterium]